MIYTGYFGMLRELPDTIVPIAVCRVVPAGYKGVVFPELFPSSGALSLYKESGDQHEFKRHYYDETLSLLNPLSLSAALQEKNPSGDVILVCYEKDGLCHRHIISEWLNNAGIEVKEFHFASE